MGAFQAILDAEASTRDTFFKTSSDPTSTPDSALDRIKESYRKGEYNGGEDRPAYNSRGRKKIQGFKASQRFKGDQDRQDERDKFFHEAAGRRWVNTTTEDKEAERQIKRSYDRQKALAEKRYARS